MGRHYFFDRNRISVCAALMFLLQIYRINGMYHDTMQFSSRIIGGEEALREQWPFIAALFKVKDSNYFCGGTLISNKHVLTTANCIQNKGSSQNLYPDDIVVRLGAYNLTKKNEEGAVDIKVSKIYVHPDWRVYDEAYDADIAILVLNETIPLTNYIQPVYLPADELIIDSYTINVTGTIVGWGLAENRAHEEVPRQALIQTFNDSYCYRSDYGTVILSSARTFCGGNGEGTPNIGDSGSGLFVYNGTDWVQYGIISASSTNGIGQIVRSSYTVYVNVKALKNWIIETTKIDDVVEATGITDVLKTNKIDDDDDDDVETTNINNEMKIELHCKLALYSFFAWNKYRCFVNSHLNIRTENTAVTSFTRNKGWIWIRERNVIALRFQSGTMFFLPNGIGKVFTNLKTLEVESRLGTKFIKRTNLQNLENLLQLKIDENDIELLDEDVLWDLPALEIFQLIHNKLKIVHEKMFDNNMQLREVNLHSNQLEVLPRNLFKHNRLLAEVDLSQNSLKNIEIDFTSLNNVWFNLENNDCISLLFYNRAKNRRNLEIFHNNVMTKCGQ